MIDILNPRFIPDTSNARKVSPMGKPQDQIERELEEATLQKYLQKQLRQKSIEEKRLNRIKAQRLRKLRDQVRKTKAAWDKAVKEYEEALA